MEAIFAQVLAFKIVNNQRLTDNVFSLHLILQTGFNGLFLGKPGKGVQHFPGGGGLFPGVGCNFCFCSLRQFNLLLSPYPCFISLLYLDLYVLGDDALIS